MAKKKYPVHADFAHYPAFPFPFNGLLVSVLNQFLHLQTFFTQRKIKAKAKLHLMRTQDGADIKIYQFNPDNTPAQKKLPAILYFHGGAFVLTYASTHVQAMDFYANQANCAVFMVDYRLAPAHPFPAGFNDCYAALQWLVNNADSLGIDANKILVMGDSAGGAFSAGVAQKALDEKGPALRAQVLVYPSLDRTCSTNSAKNYIDAPLFDSVANTKMWEVYLRQCTSHGTTGNIPPYAAPADRKDLTGLPPAYVETAEFDPLSDEGADYAKRLQAAGVNVELNQTRGTVHGYDTVLTSSIAQDGLKRRVEFIKAVFN